MKIKNKSHLILTLLYTPTELQGENTSITGITRLEKLVFLTKMESEILSNIDEKDNYQFKPYKMGPFSPEIYDEIDFLESLGLITSKQKKQNSDIEAVEGYLFLSDQVLDKYQKGEVLNVEQTREYRLSPKGMQIAKVIFNSLPKKEQEYLINLKRNFNNMDLKQFLRFIYNKYPYYATQSEIKEHLNLI